MIYVIGIGIHGRASLAVRALRLIEEAGLIVGGRRHLDEFPDASGRKSPFAGLKGAASAIRGHLKAKKSHVAVLATGDPLLYGIGSFILKEFGPDNVEVIPNVSVVQEAFARIKEEMNGVKVLSVHGREADFDWLALEVASNKKLALFTDRENSPAKLAKELLKRGVTCRAAVCEALGTKAEKVFKGTLEEVAGKKSFDPLNVFIIMNERGRPQESGFGLPDSLFRHSGGMITKEEFRVIALSKLCITRHSVVWDIGACSGSVAIEAARLTSGDVYAIEKEAARVKDMEENARRFNVGNLVIIKGEAPGALKGLPPPDAVFVGGGGEGISGILSFVSKRLKKGGRVVVNAVTMETASKALEFLSKKGWDKELLLVSVSKSKKAGKLTMFSANNPLFIISGRKPL
ncbi:MAG: precorrin-6y C5,15-methyltransferase (decarboxylating) subunit CbiE [Deltaproteobacteria bacterium]|nr:precorrin-6y C5,15-methyltransferase (decarboxylating) subunit CbiE [Deltaproteobacteria bacterium]